MLRHLSQSKRLQAAKKVKDCATDAANLTLPAELPKPCLEIYVGSGGSLWLTFASGARIERIGLISGMTYAWSVVKVEAGTTGTSASSIGVRY